MPAPHHPRNRGPAAAAENRAAILDAARRLFARDGYRVPLSAIARAAGVGQGVLYRHFPSRLDLAYEVFEDNFAVLDQTAAQSAGPDCFALLWRQLVEYTIDSTAFVEMVLDAGDEPPARVGAERLLGLFARPLARAQAAGLADPSWTTRDVLLLQHMVYGVIAASPVGADVRAGVRRAVELIDPRLAEAL